MPVGIYELRAFYEGDDYDVKSLSETFKIMPEVFISQNVTIEDDVNIFMDLDNSTGFILIVMDGLSPALVELENGILNYTFSTVGYSYGPHNATFLYIGNSFDQYLFYDYGPDGKFTPIAYTLNILPQEIEANSTTDLNNYYEVHMQSDAKGTIEFFIDGVSVAIVDLVDGIARLDISGFKNGKYILDWVYSGDSKYAPHSDRITIDVKHKTARIAAADLSIVYSSSKKYTVTVYDVDGKVAAGVSVTFLINNKAYKTVKTNAKGVASVAITKNPGNYKITAKSLGVSVTKKLAVKHALTLKKVTVKRSAKKLVIKATLKVDGKALKGKKITLKFNGKKIKAKTNKKGVAKFTVKSKVLKKLKAGKKVKCQATYLKDTVKKSVKVKK